MKPQKTKIKVRLSVPLLEWIKNHLNDGETKSQKIEALILKGMEEEHKNANKK